MNRSLLTLAAAGTLATALAATSPAHAAWTVDGATASPAFTVGSGSSAALYVLDHDTADAAANTVIFEYRFDPLTAPTAPTAWHGLTDAAANQGDLYLKYDSDAQFGVGLFGIGFDVDGDGFSSTGNTFVNNQIDTNTVPGVSDTSTVDNSLTADDPDDWYIEDWFTAGYWAFYLNTNGGGDWAFASTGLAGESLDDQQVIALTWAPGFAASPPVIPEPATALLLAAGSLLLVRRR